VGQRTINFYRKGALVLLVNRAQIERLIVEEKQDQ